MAQAAAIYFVPGVGEAALVVTGVAVIGYGIYKGTSALLGWVFNENADESNTDDSSSGAGETCPPKRGRSWTGEPGTTEGPNAGGDSRRFGSDGYPEIDYDAPHPDEAYPGNTDHAHNWGRPANGGTPTHEDRGPSAPYSPIP